MNIIKALCLSFSMGMISCSTISNQIYWVSGSKTECNTGTGVTQCLQVTKESNLEKAQWELFYAPIEHFSFEKGFLKKIEVKEKIVKNPPADASSIRYIMIKELEKTIDPTSFLNGKWHLTHLGTKAINIDLRPELEIYLEENRISGTGGCNRYFADIKEINPNTLLLGVVASTRRMCHDEQVEDKYFATLEKVHHYYIKNNQLYLLDKKKNTILIFRK